MLAPGGTFDRYKIEGLLGEGGMGRVYSAFDPRLHRRVALKVLSLPSAQGARGEASAASAGNSSEGAARMLREARAAAALDHPNAVAIFDVGEVDGVPFIAMELIEGRSLRWHIGRAGISWDRRLRWLTDVARALGAAHKRGLVHRDIKPENVMVRDDGVVKVLDFGIARRPDVPVDPNAATQQMGLEALTGKGLVVGTPRYMSPEQMRGDALDGRTDQFAWGVLAFELLSGKPPWKKGDDSLAAVAEVLTREPEALEVDGLPEVVQHAVRRAISRSADDRFPSMDALIRALDPFVTGSTRDVTEPSIRNETAELTATQTEMAAASPTPHVDPPRAQKEAPLPAPHRSWMSIAGLVSGVLALIIASVLALRARTPRPAAPQIAPSTSPARAAPTAVTDLPDPPTQNREALAAYRAGMQAYRDGVGDVQARFRRAAELDPNLAAAHMRLARLQLQPSPNAARASYQRAFELRRSLSERDQLVLAALEPSLVFEPPDPLESGRRFQAALARFPFDAELWLIAGGAASPLGDRLRALEKAVELDPKFARAWWQLGQMQAYAEDIASAQRSLERCLAVAPSATSCLWNRIAIDEIEGACDRVEADARRWTTADGADPLGHFALASALYARGRPRESVEQALHQKESLDTGAEQTRSVAHDRLQMAVLAGDFEQAEKRALELEHLASASQSELDHQPQARALIEIYLETGRLAAAARYAEDYLRRREAWLRDPYAEDFALAGDVELRMDHALRAAGRIGDAELARRLAAWKTTWQRKGHEDFLPFVWMHGDATLAETPEGARRALESAPSSIPRYTPKTLVLASVGRVYLLAGRIDEALPYLERAATSCLALELPFAETRAHLWLGEAREAKGDTGGACKAYAAVAERWANAKPRSVSAEAARARMKALRCP